MVFGVGLVPNRGLAADALRHGDSPLGAVGTDPTGLEGSLPGRRDYGVGLVPNRDLAADTLWCRDRPLGGVGTDPAVGMSFVSEFDLIVKI